MKEKIDFKVARAEDCVLIDTKNWIQNYSNAVTIHRMSGRDVVTYIAEVLSANPKKEEFKNLVKEGDLILVTRIASEVSSYRAFAIKGEDKRYYNVPIMQVIGVFEDKDISVESLSLLTDKILVKKIEPKYGALLSSSDNTMLGEVIKVGSFRFNKNWEPQPLRVKAGNIALIKDNVSTEIIIKGEKYYAVEEAAIVGITNKKDTYTLEDFELISESVIMEQYRPEKVLNSTILETPDLNFEDLDYSELHNRDLFKIVGVDSNLTELKKNDKVLLNRDLTNYVYFDSNKYFILNGMEFIEGKVEE